MALSCSSCQKPAIAPRSVERMRLAATKATTPAKTPPRTGAAAETAAASLPPVPAFAAAGTASAACRAARDLA